MCYLPNDISEMFLFVWWDSSTNKEAWIRTGID